MAMKNQNWNEILDFVLKNYDEFVKADVGGHNSYGKVREMLEAQDFEITDIALGELLDTLQMGLVDVCVKQIRVIHAYGAQMWNLIELSQSPMLVAQIPLWLSSKGYMKLHDTYLASDWSVAWEGLWTRHAVVWSNTADDTYFIYVSRSYEPIGSRHAVLTTSAEYATASPA